MNIRNKISVLGLTASALLAIGASPALAQSHNTNPHVATERIAQASNVPTTARGTGRVEMYTDINYSGYNVTVEAGVSRSSFPSEFNDQISSLQNFQDVPYCFYSGNDYTNNWVYVPSGSQVSDLRAYGINDVISSLRPATNTLGEC